MNKRFSDYTWFLACSHEEITETTEFVHYIGFDVKPTTAHLIQAIQEFADEYKIGNPHVKIVDDYHYLQTRLDEMEAGNDFDIGEEIYAND